jgi:hypothetical protein
MPKTPLSVTLDDGNLLWLKGRATGRKKRSLSEALDEVLTEARRGGAGADVARSVVGTVDIAGDDPFLERADAAVRSLLDESLSRPILVRETPDAHAELPAATDGAGKQRG